MRLAYLLKANLKNQNHLVNKVYDQINYWINSPDYEVEIKVYFLSETDDDTCSLDDFNISYYHVGKREVFELFHMSSAYKAVLNDLASFAPEVIYTRTWTPRLFTLKFTKRFKVISEVNTKELDEYKLLATKNIKSRLKYIYYKNTKSLFYNNLSGICCVTNEIAKEYTQYRLPTYVIPNSIPLKNYTCGEHVLNRIPKIFFIGSPGMPWQGFDIILKLAELTQGRLEFHLVGENDLGIDTLPKNVISYGLLNKEKYEPILTSCDIGLGTMALYRKNMYEACPLKVREYLAHGLPIILPYKDTAFLKDSPEWVLNITATQGNVLNNNQVDSIVSFSNKMKGKRVQHEDSKKYIDANYLEKERLGFIKSIITNFPSINVSSS